MLVASYLPSYRKGPFEHPLTACLTSMSLYSCSYLLLKPYYVQCIQYRYFPSINEVQR